MVFLDTNVFLYALGAPHPLRERCRSVLRSVGDGSLEANTSIEVLQEILHVLQRRDRLPDGLAMARNLLGQFPDILPVTARDLAAAADLLEGSRGLPVRDAVHAATMKNNGITDIVTADPHFTGIPGIRPLDPAGDWLDQGDQSVR